VVQVAGLLLIEFGHGREWTRYAGAVDDGAEGLHCCGIRLKQSDFGVAESAPRHVSRALLIRGLIGRQTETLT
jgi:hypothetical protein